MLRVYFDFYNLHVALSLIPPSPEFSLNFIDKCLQIVNRIVSTGRTAATGSQYGILRAFLILVWFTQ
jgi:hypothetical protein